MIGVDTFAQFSEMLKSQGTAVPPILPETSHFRFGNGARETSTRAVQLPVVIAGRPGTIRASLVQGKAPLLISRKALLALQAKIDFGKGEMTIFSDERVVPLGTDAAGQFTIQLLEPPRSEDEQFEEIMMSDENAPSTMPSEVSRLNGSAASGSEPVVEPPAEAASEASVGPGTDSSSPSVCGLG